MDSFEDAEASQPKSLTKAASRSLKFPFLVESSYLLPGTDFVAVVVLSMPLESLFFEIEKEDFTVSTKELLRTVGTKLHKDYFIGLKEKRT